jgi:phosphoribosyl 1,2-cyclic phosphate phosphodiesterase
MIGKFLFLGTGASAGVPVVGCKCSVCLSNAPHNQRLRTSGLLKVNGKCFLIDVGPDFRQQALRYKLDHLDGLLLTHTHFDHIAGIDELRVFYLREKKYLPCLLSFESLEDLKVRYAYLFQPIGTVPTISAQIEMHLLKEDLGEVDFLGLNIGYCSYFQGNTKVNGFRLGRFAYISDIKEYDESIFIALKGVEKLVISALLEGDSPLHFSLNQAIDFAKKVGVNNAFITHISHRMDYESVSKKLPSFIQLGVDGMEVEFEY